MKKYRPYPQFPTDIVGKVVRDKEYKRVVIVDVLYEHTDEIRVNGYTYSTDAAFEKFEFVDGSPVGEEKFVLLRDALCCVRGINSVWIPRYFCNESNGILYFYMDGKTSYTSDGKTSAWDYVAEYDDEIVGTMQEPKNGYIKHIEN